MKMPLLYTASRRIALAGAFSLTVSLLASAPHAVVAADEAEGAGSIVLAGHTFTFAKPWAEKQVTSPMRAAELTFDHADEALADLELVFYHFPNQGGGTRANLDRWIGQFEGEAEVSEEDLEFDGTKVVLLTAKGTFNESSGGPFSGNTTPRADYTMLAAVVETDSGPVFLKLTGPDASVAAMKDEFKKLATSPFAKE